MDNNFSNNDNGNKKENNNNIEVKKVSVNPISTNDNKTKTSVTDKTDNTNKIHHVNKEKEAKVEDVETSTKSDIYKELEENEKELEKQDKKFERLKDLLDWLLCIMAAFIIALVVRFYVGTPTVVKSISMQPTLYEGQRLILNRIPRTFHQEIKRGQIITFEKPSSLTTDSSKAKYEYEPSTIFGKFSYYVLEINKTSYIKRVIGVAGDHVVIKNGKVYVNDEELHEDYLQKGMTTEAQNPELTDFVVPDGYVFAMGDNRTGSTDCRAFGCVPLDKVESVVWIRFWPFDEFGEIKSNVK